MKPQERLAQARLPEYSLFHRVCHTGLHAVRPLNGSAASSDSEGWNYGSGLPPSYSAYGRMRALVALADAEALQPKSVLEIAAGDAALSASLAMQGRQVAANDLRKENLENAVSNFENASKIRLLPGNLFELDPAVAGQHDLVIACEIVEHVAHTVDFLKQLKRFVAPGGHILLTTPNGSYFRNTLPTHSMIQDFTALESQEFKPDADGHLFLITPEEMVALAREAGLTVERLSLWGTPFITGHAGVSRLSPVLPFRMCHSLERSTQNFSFATRAKYCFSMSLVLGL
jgi:2-polyprenyl-3-methyl-5-hydroxy-6-metoxy-1,4-benzoquinol methylase